MRKMKNSGIEWIGEIPEEWEVKRVKNLIDSFSKGTGITKEEIYSDGDTPCVRYGEIYTKYDTSFCECYSYTKKKSLLSYRFFQHGDLLCAGTGELVEEIGKTIAYMGNDNCLAGGDIIVLSHSQDPIFLSYAMNCHYIQSQRSSGKSKLKVVHVSASEIGNSLITIPSKEEQHSIATYLDRKCSEIDSIVRETEQTIEEYRKLKQSLITEVVTGKKRVAADGLSLSNEPRKMKNSGVEWIGDLPEEWRVTRVGLLFDIILGKMLCDTPQENYSLEDYYCAANVHFEGVSDDNLKKMWFSIEEKKKYEVKVGDLLVVEGGAGAGGCAIVKSLEGDKYIQNSIMIVRSDDYDNRVLRYSIEYMVKQGYIDFVCNKATIPHFTKEKLSQMPFALPSLPEQHLIATYLDRKCSEIDKLIADKQTLLQELDIFKKSLIYECVTGKREVN